MIPQFPNFKRLELSDRSEVENIIKDFPPYSDYNFTSLWCWDTKDQVMVSQYEGHLIVRFTDYMTTEPFYSFVGTNYPKTDEIAEKLITNTMHESRNFALKLVPENTVKNISCDKFISSEDEDNFDYILPVDKLSTYAGNKYGPKRNFVNRFNRNYLSKTKILEIDDFSVRDHIERVFDVWISQKGLDYSQSQAEHKAISRLFNMNKHENIFIVGVFVNDALVGFTINERLNNKNAILHFEKADAENFVGIYQYLMLETAKALDVLDFKFLNYEQDLGLPGLRKCKKSYYPSLMLKKYKIESK